MARPRGSARGSVSAIWATPELAEKRTVTGTSCLKCNALLTLAASALGANLPSRTTPLAWADRCVVCFPNAAFSASTNDSGVVAIVGSFCVFIPVLSWNNTFPRATRRGSWRSRSTSMRFLCLTSHKHMRNQLKSLSSFSVSLLDHAAFRQRTELAARQPQFVAEDFHIVLADQRR